MKTKNTVAVTASAVLILATAAVRGQSIPPVMTAKSLPPATVALIDPESGTSSGGGSSDIKIAVGDVILFRFRYFTSPNNALRGIAGYLTEYVPPNTKVVGVRMVDKDGLTVLPRYPGLVYDGTGGGSNSFTVDCGPGNCSITGGSLAQVYADTGIFWTASNSLVPNPVNQFLTFTNGTALNTSLYPDPDDDKWIRAIFNLSAPSYGHNAWDVLQSGAFGAASSPGYGPNTPYGYGSPVAGSSTHYSFDATLNGTQIEFTGHTGPWNRVIYPGSTIGVGAPPTADPGALERALQAINTGDQVTPLNPRTATAVRFALGELRAGEPGYVEVALQVTALPLNPNFGTNGNVDCGEIFGGNVAKSIGGSGQRGTKNAWPSFLPAPACVYLNLLFDIDVDKVRIGTGTDVTYSLRAKNLSLANDTNVCVRYRWGAGNPVVTPPGGSSTPPAGCPACPGGFSCMYWKPGTMIPSQEWPSTGNWQTMLFSPSGGGQMAAVMYADYYSDRVPSGYTTQVMTIISPISFIDLKLNDPGYVAANANSTVTGTIQNTGAAVGQFNKLALWFPAAGWTITNGGATLTNCVQLTPPAGYSWNHWQCDFVDTAFSVNELQNLNLTIHVPTGTANGLYPIDAQIWARDNGNGGDFDTVFPSAFVQPVGLPRTAAPVVGTPASPAVPNDSCQIVSTTNGVWGTSEPNATIKLFFNGVLYASGTADGTGNWNIPASAWAATFGALYGGAEIRATATAPGKLESPLSNACFPRPTKQCSDGIDNDGDGFTDFPADPGCSSPTDDSELPDNRIYPATDECNDGIDNDGDGLTDMADPDCQCPGGVGRRKVERPGVKVPQCSDGCDNDGDGKIDYPADPGCHSANDDSEADVTEPPVVSPRLLLVFDTSGSMNWNTCGDNTFMQGDGSSECPGIDLVCNSPTCAPSGCGNTIADDTRLFKVKSGVAGAVTAFGEIEWGLMRFHQRGETFGVVGADTGCPTSNASLRAGGWQGSFSPPCSGGFSAADLLVRFSSDNTYDLLQWMDGRSNWTDWGNPAPSGNPYALPNPTYVPAGFDFELRGTGTTPLAGSLASALTTLQDTKGADPKGNCRPYRVILVTDGAETCSSDPSAPATAAAALLTAGFPTYVIGFATPDVTIRAKLQAIAAAGRTGGTAIFADDSVSLSAAIGGIVQAAIKPELCNGIDDNCNDVIDEGFPVGQACSNGRQGICFCPGAYVCNAAQDGVDCALTGAPGPNQCKSAVAEICCNGLDDNCDGRVDEGCSCVELCDGIDNNGNGLTDEGFTQATGGNLGLPCTNGLLGECTRSGTYVCSADGRGTVCSAATPAPQEESCDCKDNNCNGLTDEGVSRECFTGATGCTLVSGSYQCQGECRPGLQICDSVAAGTCPGAPHWTNPSCGGQILPTTEVCNGLDDDCNGAVDDGIPDRDCYTGTTGCDVKTGICKGTCRMGKQSCSAGVWGACVGEVTPAAESCDGQDHDCNGVPNDIPRTPCYPGGTQGCTLVSGTYQCQGVCQPGGMACSGGVPVCQGAVVPSSEICDGVDNNCDGSIDEGLTVPCYTGGSGCNVNTGVCVGACRMGTRTCTNGTWGSCTGQVVPTAETCDGVDNDCNGTTDDIPRTPCYPNGQSGCNTTTLVCQGACRMGTTACSGTSTVCQGAVIPTTEVCDGIDNNCDGTVDNLAPRACYTGPAGTESNLPCHGGTQTCSGGAWGPCTGQVLPSPEVCDGVDNNCNGQTDENLTQVYYSGPLGTRNVGECRDGIKTCIGGNYQVTTAEVLPAAQELCNGLDDNCNGQIDEGLTRSYYNGPSGTSGVGICTPGIETCQVGNWNVTTPAIVPRPEDCNGLDDNCNGQTDELLTGVPCYPDATPGCNVTLGLCVGTCSLGVRDCNGGFWGSCTGMVTPQAELCDGLDNNCDGQVDENLIRDYYTGPNGTDGIGECHHGEETCNLGTWAVTLPQVVPIPETCNSKDDDCNGATDDGLDAVICYPNQPADQRVGCDVPSGHCWNLPNTPCTADNQCPTGCNPQTGLCIGACTFGTMACVGGAFGVCTGAITPTPEVCNGLDDDCNGQIDESLTRNYYTGPPLTSGVGPCHDGVETCNNGQWFVTTAEVVPAPETCNFVDDDCNGSTDDGLAPNRCYDGGNECDVQAATCIGQCRVGVKPCVDGSYGSTCVGQQLPVPEVCNCLDDNCDGRVDEAPGAGDPPLCDTGTPAKCAGDACVTAGGCNGTFVCDQQACGMVCKATGGGGVEKCNGVDDDCDGLIDEMPGPNEPELCDDQGKCAGATHTCLPPFPQQGWTYVCAAGHNECINGSIQCVDFVLPQKEICDGKDNDCDGVIDNGDLCDPGSVCYAGECVPPCKNDEFPCPSGRVCIAGPDPGTRQNCAQPGIDECYCIPSICLDVACEAGSLCHESDGQCHSLCENVTCAVNQECRFGQCVDCSVIGCPAGQLCAGGACVDDPCSDPAFCPAGQNCINGECVDTCQNGCGAGEFCRNGHCVTDPCADVVCGGVKVCNPQTGTCEENPCIGVSCAGGAVCSTKTGQCGPDPCSLTVCSDCQECVADLYNMVGACKWNNICTTTKVTAVGGCTIAQRDAGSAGWPAVLLLGALGLLGAARRRPRLAAGRAGRALLLVAAGAAALALSACDLRWYEFKPDGGETHLDGPERVDTAPAQVDGGDKLDATKDTSEPCIPIPETCNGRDDDCNGITDDVDPDVLKNDPNNCGACGNSCSLPQTVGTCVDGQCAFACSPGWVDTNNDLSLGMNGSNGCECFKTNLGVETCDGVDNDCDGVVDNVPASAKLCDPNDASRCAGDPCYPQAGCPGGVCKGECRAGVFACQGGKVVCEGMVGPSAETCDGKDNDCNGQTDEGVAATERCYSGTSGCDLVTGTCAGICKLGYRVCNGADGWGACIGEQTPQPETCNGLDDDCDGVVDNPPVGGHLPGVTDPCYPAQGCENGVCKGECHAGAQQCQNGRFTCVGAQGPSPEVCDGKDNDCNGVTDDGLPPTPCYTKGSGCDVAAGTCHGICKLGRISCLGAQGWSQCQGDVGPRAEVCNGIDDNCDGNVDEGTLPEVGDDCFPQAGCPGGVCKGECHPGSKACQGGAIVCVGPQGPAPETCDNKDNDCNGLTDDGLPPRACYTLGSGCDTTTGICKGICKMGRQTCNGTPQWGSCDNQVGPADEVCNGIDDNCDGQIDNPPAGQTFLPGEDADCFPAQGCENGICKGECRPGKTRCVGGQMICQGAVGPTAEVCDGKDNNCDGQTDEGLVPRLCYPTGCDTGTGTCRADPLKTCTGDADCTGCDTGTGKCRLDPLKTCTADADCTPACNVQTGTCVGPCRFGRSTCQGATGWGACTGAILPEQEVCDGIDNNCDGQTDNPPAGQQLPGVGDNCPPAQGCDTGTCLGECKMGQQACQNGSLVCNGAVGPTAETCDGKDNDCNGLTDDGLGAVICYPSGQTGCNLQTGLCVGTCAFGTAACVNGVMGQCLNAKIPTAELCNGLDDNCDGVVDNGALGVGDACYPLGSGNGCTLANGVWSCKGECKTGLQVCTQGSLDCVGDVGPATEVCDGLDNNCDGQTDENLTRSYYTGPGGTRNVGICRDGTESCVNASWTVTAPQVLPTTESCNGLDDDCNGVVDNVTFLPGEKCFTGARGCTGSGASWTCTGECKTGTPKCNAGVGHLTCEGEQGPVGEVCDGKDNDCDGTTDNGFDLNTDVKNCGACGNDCTSSGQHPESAHTIASCGKPGGLPTSTCVYVCKPNYWDNNGTFDANGVYKGGGWPADGCEYACVYTGLEVCDGVDNDCNGKTDTLDPGMIVPPPFCRQLGACAGSTQHCQPYSPTLLGERGDTANQLDSWTITGANDINTDGGMLYVTVLFASPTRTVSLYRSPTFNPTDLMAQGSRGSDGVITLAEANGSGLSGSVTSTNPQTTNTITYGVAIVTWVCDYTANVDVVGLNEIATTETRCDNIDNNCDGATDESFLQKGLGCDNGQLGACYKTGTYVCTTDHTGTVCNAPAGTPQPEVCNGIDDDCNGATDDAATDDMVNVGTPTQDGRGGYRIDRYEASRPDAKVSSSGAFEYRSCSTLGVLPWSGVSHIDAADACAAAGKRLCTESEWQVACGGPSNWVYPYAQLASGYLPNACNGHDYSQYCAPIKEVGDELNQLAGWLINGATTANTDAGTLYATLTNSGSTRTVSLYKNSGLTSKVAEGSRTGDGAIALAQQSSSGLSGSVTVTYVQNDLTVQLLLDMDVVMPTGKPLGCPDPPPSTLCTNASYGTVDMSGNLREWTATPVSGGAAYRVRGGSYDDIAEALTCQFSFWAFSPATFLPNVGFRCCTRCVGTDQHCPSSTVCNVDGDCPSGFCDPAVDASGVKHCAYCLPYLANSNNNSCGACGHVCPVNTTCKSGICQ